MRLDSPGLTTDLALLRAQGSTITDHGDHVVVRTDANPSYWWGNYVLVPTQARADEVDRWTARFEEEFPDAHHRAVGFALSGGDTEAWAEQGWTIDAVIDLATTSLPAEAEVSDGIRLRPLVNDDDWEQSALVSTADSPEHQREGHLDFERLRVQGERRLVESGRARWFGAFDGDLLVGTLGIVRLDDLARYQNVVTLPSHRRRGIAGALVRRAGEWAMEDPAVRQLVIVAEDGGPAIGLYRRAGFSEVARHLGVARPPAQD